MRGAAERALQCVRKRAAGGRLSPATPVTVTFHPDTIASGVATIERLAREGVYRSQFETGTSNGGMTAHPGGDRWLWESRIFDKAYDDADPASRPKYGALNHRRHPVGGSPRFGSCHLRLRPHVLARTTFCYPDSHLRPDAFGVADRMALIELVEENRLGLDPVLDNYVEAHVHGALRIERDVEAVVLDPSYRGGAVEEQARSLGCAIEWHDGFRLASDRFADCAVFRSPVAAEAAAAVSVGGVVTPRDIGAARGKALDHQTAKWVWHCVVRFGRDWRA